MIIYLSKTPIKFQTPISILIEASMEKEGIVGLMPTFTSKEKAEKFLGKDGYLIMSQD